MSNRLQRSRADELSEPLPSGLVIHVHLCTTSTRLGTTSWCRYSDHSERIQLMNRKKGNCFNKVLNPKRAKEVTHRGTEKGI